MDSCPLYMLHDSRDKHIFAVRYNINLKLGTRHILVHQHRILDAGCKDSLHILQCLIFRPGYCHILATNYIAWPKQHRISQCICCLHSFFQTLYTHSLGAGDGKLL